MVRKTALCLMLVASAGAQENAPPGLLRGILLNWTSVSSGGAFTFLGFENKIYSCSYDRKTYMERDNELTTFAHAQRGDRLEIVTDRAPSSNACYARTVHILENPQTRLAPRLRPRAKEPSLAVLPPRANLTYTGVVIGITSSTLTLRSRSGDRQSILLRPDTHFLAEGQLMDRGSLRANTKVFVRAGKNLDEQVEAYQVIWGEILDSDQ